jgi:transposase
VARATRCRPSVAAGCAAGREGGDMIAAPTGVKVLVATKPVDFRNCVECGSNSRHDPFCGTIFIFRSKRAQRTTFCIRFAIREDRLSLASSVWTVAAGIAVPAWQRSNLNLHG